ncbi:RDD family protein [Bacteriovoracaceae bacterium]|nr:RDD family protein [Bacteriovoracaceae bacterium]|tara:strand:+ start:190863 stop:191579 length:717 start_codon:yes stop_codon:yes gene_type:complete
MDQTQHDVNEAIEIKFNIDEFDLENYEFKALNQGLGFHKDQKNVEPAKKSLIEGTKQVEKPNFKKATSPSSQQPRREQLLEEMALPSIMKSMATERVKSAPRERKLKLASENDRSFAFVTDFIIVGLMTLSFYVTSLSLTGVELANLFLKTNLIWSAPFLITIFCFFFMMYFSLLDADGTIGKRLFSLRLVKLNSKKPDSSDCLVRSIITLLSIPLFFFPVILDFQGKLSDTKVVKEK